MNITVKARGLGEARRALKAIDRAIGKEFRQVWLKAATLVAARADAAAPARARGVMRPRATQRAAFVRISPRRGDELAVFMGQTRRSGWYSRLRYRGSRGRQHRPWVGNQWDPGETGGKPYFVGDAINESVDDVVELIGDEIDLLAQRHGFR